MNIRIDSGSHLGVAPRKSFSVAFLATEVSPYKSEDVFYEFFTQSLVVVTKGLTDKFCENTFARH